MLDTKEPAAMPPVQQYILLIMQAVQVVWHCMVEIKELG